jgi:HK97 family phage prohead protease
VIHKEFSAVQTKVLDDSRGLCQTMFAITGSVDRQGDRIMPGAFSKALAAKSSVPVVYSHGWTDISQVLGKTTGWTELRPGSSELPPTLLSKGLGGVRANVQFELGVPAGQIAWTHVRNKNLTNWSWAFDIDSDGEKYSGNVREIKGIREIFEITLCPVGANADAMTLALQKAMGMQTANAASDAEQWARIKSYIAGQVAAEAAHPTTKAIPKRTHVAKWFDENADRAHHILTFADLSKVAYCLEMDDDPLAEYIDERIGTRAMTIGEFRQWMGSAANS